MRGEVLDEEGDQDEEERHSERESKTATAATSEAQEISHEGPREQLRETVGRMVPNYAVLWRDKVDTPTSPIFIFVS